MATRTADSVQYGDVNAAVNGGTGPGGTTFVGPAADGDTVIVPAGSATWTSVLSITKNIILRGQTTVTKVDEDTYTVVDNTTFGDNISGTSKTAGSIIYCNYNGSNPGSPVIQGITFGGRAAPLKAGFMLYVEGNSHSLRITQCHFPNTYRTTKCWIDGDTWGVMDHCKSEQDNGAERFSTNHSTYGGKTQGDGSWEDDPHFGSERAFYYEDCEFRSDSAGGSSHGNHDGQNGGRRVIRNCYLNGTQVALHGTESGGRQRGMRVIESYNNLHVMTGTNETGFQHRAGTGLYWGSEWTVNASWGRGCQPIANRQRGPFRMWGGASGQNALDNNDTEGDGTYVAGHAPHIFFTGVNTAADSFTTLSFSGISPAWNTNQWTGYEVHDETTPWTDGVETWPNSSLIASNTASVGGVATITLWTQIVNAVAYKTGDTITISRLARMSLDQAGAGKADPLTGPTTDPPTNTEWPNQASEPLYAWNNTKNGVDYTSTFFTQVSQGALPTIQENRDYYNWKGPQVTSTSPFNGTTGTGSGPISLRPTTCTKGVGYWATDQNTFYVASATNTWSVFYQPYIYPHPLVQAPTGKFISVPLNHGFGNIIIGEVGTYDIPVTNSGDTTLNVSGVSYPSGYSGPTGAFTVGPGATVNKLATFTPLAETAYTGNIVFTSDADGGNGTMAVTGTGVAPVGGGGGHGRGHKKGIVGRAI